MPFRPLFLVLILAFGSAASGCSVGYLLHLGRGQARIVCGSKPVEKLLEDPGTPADVKAKIRIVLDAKAFGEHELGLEPSKNYTTYYQVNQPAVAYNLTASPRFELTAHQWCFPIAGCLPYKGFFDLERARNEREAMAEKGYDVYLRSVAAYSTLGWFRDPIFSTMMRYPDEVLAETILHEMVHGTVFVKHQGAFNEGVATFVGREGVRRFLARSDDAGERLERLEARWAETAVFRDAMSRTAERLRALYASDLGKEAMLRERETIFREEQAAFQGRLAPERVAGYGGLLEREWNNALVVSYLTYHADEALWASVLEAFNGNLRAIVERLKGLGETEDPYAAVRSWLKGT